MDTTDRQRIEAEQQIEEQEDREVAAQEGGAFDDPEADATFAAYQEAQRLQAYALDAETTLETRIPLDKLITASQFQIRQSLTEVFVKRYVAAYEVGADMPPVEVAIVRGETGTPAYYLVDGFHRVEALHRLGHQDVQATIYELPSLNAVLWKGWEKNQHGVHYTKEERITAFKLYLSMGQYLYRPRGANGRVELKSIRQIAKEWFKAPATIWKMICKLDKKLAAQYRARATGRMERPGTSAGNPKGRQLQPVDVARRSLKDVENIAKAQPKAQQEKILRATETMIERVKNLETGSITEKPWTPTDDATDF